MYTVRFSITPEILPAVFQLAQKYQVQAGECTYFCEFPTLQLAEQAADAITQHLGDGKCRVSVLDTFSAMKAELQDRLELTLKVYDEVNITDPRARDFVDCLKKAILELGRNSN